MYPLTIGPIAGPANGANEKNAMAMPRRSLSQISPITPPAFVRGQAAKAPEKKRKSMMAAVFGASAQPIWNLRRKGERGVRVNVYIAAKRSGEGNLHPVDKERDEEGDAPTVYLPEGQRGKISFSIWLLVVVGFEEMTHLAKRRPDLQSVEDKRARQMCESRRVSI